MGNNYCKKDYSKGEVDVVEITQRSLQNLKKNVAMTSFYCLVCNIFKKTVFHVVIRTEKNAWFVLFLKRKKITITFLFMQVSN